VASINVASLNVAAANEAVVKRALDTSEMSENYEYIIPS
jgi:hypothetical protein